MNKTLLKTQLDKLRADASKSSMIPSSVVFAHTDVIMNELARKPTHHACCGFPVEGGHNGSCTFYGADEPLTSKECE